MTGPLSLGLSGVLSLWTLSSIRRALLDHQAGFPDFFSGRCSTFPYVICSKKASIGLPLLSIELCYVAVAADAVKAEGEGTQSLQQTRRSRHNSQRSEQSEHSEQRSPRSQQQQHTARMRRPPSSKTPSPTR